MEIKIYCDAKVNLDKFNSAVFVECDVHNYQKNKETLSGEIVIKGEYFKDNFEEKYPFTEYVPFSIVFKSPNYQIEEVLIDDFNFLEIVNFGLETNFNIIVRYHVLEKQKDYDDENVIEVIDDEVTIIRDEDKELSEKENNKTLDEKNNDTSKEKLINSNEESKKTLTKEEISKKYDNLLKSILDSRTDNFFEENKTSNVRIINGEEGSKDSLSFCNAMKEDYYTYKVRYINKESDLEVISKKERVSIDKIYQDNKHNDFLEKRRVVIK
ncbi:MAG TPA: hypothetical protein PKO43_03060 [Bacilli bacterium]|nr:hypothetical protein [Bacilli bacterium]